MAKLHSDQAAQDDEATSKPEATSEGSKPGAQAHAPADLGPKDAESIDQPAGFDGDFGVEVASPANGDDDRVLSLTERRRKALHEARRSGLPPKVDSWRKRTATGAVLTGFALGFREALGQEPQRPAIIMEAPGDPPTDLPVDAEVSQIRPADNVVRIRPWLLPTGQETTAEPETPETQADDHLATAQTVPDTPETVNSSSETMNGSSAASAGDPLEKLADGPEMLPDSQPSNETQSDQLRPDQLRRRGRK